MTTITAPARPALATPAPARRPSWPSAWATLVGRRLALSMHNPREVLAPLATPIMFALVIAPALAKTLPSHNGIDYRSFVIVGTVGLLIPLTCAFAGIGVIVDRMTGARRELLAAPIGRGVIVAANMAVALLVSLLQVGVLMAAGVARGSHFHVRATGVGWFVAAVLAFTVFAYALAELLSNRIPTQEEYVGVVPVVAIVPWFLAGSLFRVTSMPVGLAGVSRVLPTTHALALLRYGLLERNGRGLHDIWGLHSTTAAASLSLLVVVAWAALLTTVALRVFRSTATT